MGIVAGAVCPLLRALACPWGRHSVAKSLRVPVSGEQRRHRGVAVAQVACGRARTTPWPPVPRAAPGQHATTRVCCVTPFGNRFKLSVLCRDLFVCKENDPS